MREIAWQKSSYSAAGETSCVELSAPAPDALLIRESDDPNVMLSTPLTAVRALLLTIRTGQLDGHGS